MGVLNLSVRAEDLTGQEGWLALFWSAPKLFPRWQILERAQVLYWDWDDTQEPRPDTFAGAFYLAAQRLSALARQWPTDDEGRFPWDLSVTYTQWQWTLNEDDPQKRGTWSKKSLTDAVPADLSWAEPPDPPSGLQPYEPKWAVSFLNDSQRTAFLAALVDAVDAAKDAFAQDVAQQCRLSLMGPPALARQQAVSETKETVLAGKTDGDGNPIFDATAFPVPVSGRVAGYEEPLIFSVWPSEFFRPAARYALWLPGAKSPLLITVPLKTGARVGDTIYLADLIEAGYVSAATGGSPGAGASFAPLSSGAIGEVLMRVSGGYDWRPLAKVAISGEYSDLLGRPTIPVIPDHLGAGAAGWQSGGWTFRPIETTEDNITTQQVLVYFAAVDPALVVAQNPTGNEVRADGLIAVGSVDGGGDW